MWLIIGYGNDLRSDDGAGRLLAEQLERRLPKERARVLALHQLTPELVEEMIRPEIDRVLFIDTKRHQDSPFCFTPIDDHSPVRSSFGHQQQPELLLYTAKELYGRTIAAWLLTISGDCFDFGERLSSKTEEALRKACSALPGFLEDNSSPPHLS